MMKYPDRRAYQEKVRLAMVNKDEDAMGRAMEEYAQEVARSGQVLEMYKEGMIREAREFLHEMFKALDDKLGQDPST